MTGTNVVSFVPITPNTADLASGATNAGLGNFVLRRWPTARRRPTRTRRSRSTSCPAPIDGTSIASNAPIEMTGVLNGTAKGPSSSTVQATFDGVAGQPDRAGQEHLVQLQPAGRAAAAGPLDHQFGHQLGAGPDHPDRRQQRQRQSGRGPGARAEHDRPVPDHRGRPRLPAVRPGPPAPRRRPEPAPASQLKTGPDLRTVTPRPRRGVLSRPACLRAVLADPETRTLVRGRLAVRGQTTDHGKEGEVDSSPLRRWSFLENWVRLASD